MTTNAVVLAAIGVVIVVAAWWWVRRWRARPPLQQPEGRYTIRYENVSGARLVHRGDDLREAKRVYQEADQVPKGETLEFWDGPHCRGRKLIALALALVLASSVAAQDTPQRHHTAHVVLKNGELRIYSEDSAGARVVRVQLGGLVVDTLIGFPRGGTWTWDTAQVVRYVPSLLADLDALAAGQRQPFDATYPSLSGVVKSVRVHCTQTTGCAVTIVNRAKDGTTRAGSWTNTPRLTLAQTRELVGALREAALQETGHVVVLQP